MKKSYRTVLVFGFGVLEFLVLMSVSAQRVHAETRVGGLISQDTVWSREAGPYLLTENVTVLDGASLTVKAGTEVAVAPEAQTAYAGDGPAIFVSGGRISLQGSPDARVAVKGVGGLFISSSQLHNGVAEVAETDFIGGSRISFDNSYGTIATSTIRDTDIGLYSKDSIVSVWGSRIQNNDTGIYVQPHRVFQVRAEPGSMEFLGGVGGIGNALDTTEDLYASSSLRITGSIVSDNSSRSISNGAELMVDAGQNWWGSGAGPVMQGANSIRGKVTYSPWLSAEPVLDATTSTVAACCSNILFIPGLEGTRLYAGNNQLWEPNRNADVTKLVLNSSGSSTDRAIYSGQPIGKALGFVGIYDRFMKSLDGLVSDGFIREWRAYGYDWRKSIPDVVMGVEKKATTTESLIDIVGRLASSSITGKVSIIAHSNGGLVTKYLVKALQDQGRERLIDSVISVAVPYLGTPQAVSSLLHGDGQDILGGIILKKSVARSMGTNMPSAYSLLPSREFFSKVFSPTVAFASTSMPGLNTGKYPKEIRSSADQAAFVADAYGVRKNPATFDTASAIRGNQLLINTAGAVHAILDPFEWPAAIMRWAIVGWNLATTQRVDYSAADKHTNSTSPYGDGVVVPQSAAYNAGKVIAVDLNEQSKRDGRDLSHSTILESSTTDAIIRSIVTKKGSPSVLNEISALPGVTTNEPDWNSLNSAYESSRRELRVSTHSPVELHIYDSRSNHTGLVPLPPEVAGQVEDDLYSMKENGIPGSSSEIPDCDDPNDCEGTVTIPDNGETYTVVLRGTGVGSFDMDVERIRATSTVERVQWKNIPTSPLGTATTTIGVTASSPMIIDMDGDTKVDATSSPNTTFENHRLLDALKNVCTSLDRSVRCDAFVKHIERIKLWLTLSKFKTGKSFHGYAVASHARHLSLKRMSDSDAKSVLGDMESFLSQFAP